MSAPAPRHEFYWRSAAKGGYDEINWLKPLELRKCLGHHGPCDKWVDIGLPYCAEHLRSKLGVEIKKTKHKGKGVFATRHHQQYLLVLPYVAEHITEKELDRRYGDYTAPYALGDEKKGAWDGALLRGIGTMVNAAPLAKCQCTFEETPTRMAVVNTRGAIASGEQIFVHYGEHYENDEPGVDFDTVAVKGRAKTETQEVLRKQKKELKAAFPEKKKKTSTGRGEYEHLKLHDSIQDDSDIEDITHLLPKGSHAQRKDDDDDRDYGTLHTFKGPYEFTNNEQAEFPTQDEQVVEGAIDVTDHKWHDINVRDVMLRLSGRKDSGWFSDEVFTMYRHTPSTSLHRVTLMSTFLYSLWEHNNMDAVKRVWQEGVKDAKSVLAIPVNLGRNHWAMVIVDHNKIVYHDSMSTGRANDVTSKIEAMLKAVGRGGSYIRYVAKDTPQQTNGNDCGAYALLVAFQLNAGEDYRIKGQPQDIIQRFREFLMVQFAVLVRSHPDVKAPSRKKEAPAEVKKIEQPQGAPFTHPPMLPKLARPQRRPHTQPARDHGDHGDHHTKLHNFDQYCMHYLRVHNVTHQANRQKLRESELQYLRRMFDARKYYSEETRRFRTHHAK